MREGEERKLKKLKEEERLAEERMAEVTALSLAQCNDKRLVFFFFKWQKMSYPLSRLYVKIFLSS